MSEYVVFALAFAASAAAPGPEIAALLGRALTRGIASTVPLGVGIVLGKLTMLTAAVLGLAVLVEVLGPVFVVLKYAGAAYLLYLGVKRWRSAGRRLDEDDGGRPARLLPEVGLGLAITLSNPIAIVFYVALLPGVVDIEAMTVGTYVTLCGIVTTVMAVVVLSYGSLAELVRRAFTSATAKTNVDRGSGAMMIGAGILIAARSSS